MPPPTTPPAAARPEVIPAPEVAATDNPVAALTAAPAAAPVSAIARTVFRSLFLLCVGVASRRHRCKVYLDFCCYFT